MINDSMLRTGLVGRAQGRFPALDPQQGPRRGDLHRLHRDLPRPRRDEGRVRGVRRHGQQGAVRKVPGR